MSESTVNASQCSLCGSSAIKTLKTPDHWIGPEVFADLEGKIGLAKCKDCGFVFVNPKPSPERLEAFYSGITYECHKADGTALAGSKSDFLLDRLEAVVPAGSRRLLDFGCGGGAFLDRARSRGWSVRGFEPGARGRATCHARGLDVVGDLAEVPSASADLVTFHHVFEHLLDHEAALASVRRLLAPGGRVFIEVPNAASLRARLAAPALTRPLNLDERYRAFPIHLSYFNAKTFLRTLEKSGFNVQSHFTVGLGLDELRNRPEPSAPPPARGVGTRRKAGLLRKIVKGMILGPGLGENLCAIAQP